MSPTESTLYPPCVHASAHNVPSSPVCWGGGGDGGEERKEGEERKRGEEEGGDSLLTNMEGLIVTVAA